MAKLKSSEDIPGKRNKLISNNSKHFYQAEMPERSNGSGLGPDGLVPTQVRILFSALIIKREKPI